MRGGASGIEPLIPRPLGKRLSGIMAKAGLEIALSEAVNRVRRPHNSLPARTRGLDLPRAPPSPHVRPVHCNVTPRAAIFIFMLWYIVWTSGEVRARLYTKVVA